MIPGLESVNLELVFKYVGMISVFVYLFIMLGDFVVTSITLVVKKTTSTTDDIWAEKISFWWGAFKEIYEEYRKFIDRFSAFSRPRKPKATKQSKIK